MHAAFTVSFPNRRSANAVEVRSMDELGSARLALGLAAAPTLVLVGGAAGLSDGDSDELRPLFVDTIAPLIGELGAQVIDGGTDVGVMRLIGGARAELRLSFPLVGVAAVGNVAVPGRKAATSAAELEPHHTHFLLVDGAGWGTEAPWIARLATMLAEGHPSLTLLVGGGEISWSDASESVAAGRPIVAVAGSGGAADALDAHLRGARADRRALPLVSSGLVIGTRVAEAGASIRTILGRPLRANA